MKKTILFFLILYSYTTSINAQNMKVKITIGNNEFTAILNDSETSLEFVKLLPMNVTMWEHNGNEKYYNLPNKLPGKATNPGQVESGDLMIWSSSTLVLFYAGSSTHYSYIRLGKVDNLSGLSQALGKGSVKVKFDLEETE